MVTKAKHLQFVSGVGITVFWLSNLVWDYVSFLVPACGMLLTLLAFQEEGFIEAETQGTGRADQGLKEDSIDSLCGVKRVTDRIHCTVLSLVEGRKRPVL